MEMSSTIAPMVMLVGPWSVRRFNLHVVVLCLPDVSYKVPVPSSIMFWFREQNSKEGTKERR